MIGNFVLSNGVFRRYDCAQRERMFVAQSRDPPGIDATRMKRPQDLLGNGKLGAARAESFRFQG